MTLGGIVPCVIGGGIALVAGTGAIDAMRTGVMHWPGRTIVRADNPGAFALRVAGYSAVAIFGAAVTLVMLVS
jgi:hypothetical protein